MPLSDNRRLISRLFERLWQPPLPKVGEDDCDSVMFSVNFLRGEIAQCLKKPKAAMLAGKIDSLIQTTNVVKALPFCVRASKLELDPRE
jgi:hypothetical protein